MLYDLYLAKKKDKIFQINIYAYIYLLALNFIELAVLKIEVNFSNFHSHSASGI